MFQLQHENPKWYPDPRLASLAPRPLQAEKHDSQNTKYLFNLLNQPMLHRSLP